MARKANRPGDKFAVSTCRNPGRAVDLMEMLLTGHFSDEHSQCLPNGFWCGAMAISVSSQNAFRTRFTVASSLTFINFAPCWIRVIAVLDALHILVECGIRVSLARLWCHRVAYRLS